MAPKTFPCPFCQRPLQIPLTKNGKIGCRQCRNVSSYNVATGTLTPLAAQNVKPKNPGQAQSHPRPWLLISLLCAAGLAAALFLAFQHWDARSLSPNSPVEELKALLKALAE